LLEAKLGRVGRGISEVTEMSGLPMRISNGGPTAYVGVSGPALA
jgi:hypothetical protein